MAESDEDVSEKPFRTVFRASIPKVGEVLTDLSPDIKLRISIDPREKVWLEEAGRHIREQVKETSDKVDYRWKVTQWLFAAVLAVNIIGLLLI